MVTESAPKSAVKEASLPQTSSYAHYCGGGCTERTLDDKAGMERVHQLPNLLCLCPSITQTAAQEDGILSVKYE